MGRRAAAYGRAYGAVLTYDASAMTAAPPNSVPKPAAATRFPDIRNANTMQAAKAVNSARS